ncbi:MAG: D-aminoacyl-tRNA deacylase [Gammaproteobacteria bacterium]|nr:D-aminoacyl-tRNA deacylase [Gammaproteobacteria bacterium]
MIGLLQRVNWGRLTIDGQVRGEIGKGLVVLVGIEKDDDESKVDRLLHRVLSYRVFGDADDKMNLSLQDIGGDLLLVSQFTLAATTDKGLRPGFSSAMPPALAEPLYDYLVREAARSGIGLATGVFGADMKVALENDGPVTFLLRV